MFGFIEKLSHALFGIAGIIMKLTPIGAFAQPVGGLAASLSGTKATPLAKAIGKDVKLTAEVINLLNRKVSDVDYFYESRRPREAAAVSDIHTHRAEPRALRLGVIMYF